MPVSQEAELHGKPWYAGACDRKSAEEALHRSNKVWASKDPTLWRSSWIQLSHCRGVGPGLFLCPFSSLRVTYFVLPSSAFLPLISRLCGVHCPSNNGGKREAGEVWGRPDAAGTPPWSEGWWAILNQLMGFKCLFLRTQHWVRMRQRKIKGPLSLPLLSQFLKPESLSKCHQWAGEGSFALPRWKLCVAQKKAF